MNKNKQYVYFQIRSLENHMKIEFENLAEFIRFVELQQCKNLFVTSDATGKELFATVYQGSFVVQENAGFRTIEDYQYAISKGFTDSESFYDAQKIGYTTIQEYVLMKESGIDNKETYEVIKKQGYLEGFALINKQLELQEAALFSSPYHLYQLASKNGFENYGQYFTAFSAGFEKASTYKIAVEKGYENAADYEQGLAGNFLNADEFRMARSKDIYTRAELELCANLELLGERAEFFDQRVLLTILSKLPQGKKVSVNKLNQLFQEALAEYKPAYTDQFYSWFTIQMNDISGMVRFLKKSDTVKEYGEYDNDGEYFETKKLQQRKVIIDGSNVAFNSGGKSDAKPFAANMLKMVNALVKQGFTDILIISDAALKHRLPDKEVITAIRDLSGYMEAPADAPADIFIINYVKHHHCLLVSNDTFREWKMHDSWVAENIDYYRISFLITDDIVLLPDLEN